MLHGMLRMLICYAITDYEFVCLSRAGGARQECREAGEGHPAVQLQEQDGDPPAGARHVPTVPDAGAPIGALNYLKRG